MNFGEKKICTICYLDNWRLLFGLNDIKNNRKLVVLYEFINDKKNLISRLIIQNEFKEKINCIKTLTDENPINYNISKNIAVGSKDCFIKIINIDLYQDKYKLLQTINTGDNNYVYNILEVKNKFLISSQSKNILILKKINSFNTNSYNIYIKKYDIQTNAVTSPLILSSEKGDFIGLQPKFQKIFFYVNTALDSTLHEILTQNNLRPNEANIIQEYAFNGEIKFPSNINNIYLLRTDILGCNDEESVFLIDINVKVIVAQILLGLKIYSSHVTWDFSLIFCSINKKNDGTEDVEFIQYKLNNDKDNMVRLKNKKKNLPGIDQFYCLEENTIIFYDSRKNNMTIMKGKDDEKNN